MQRKDYAASALFVTAFIVSAALWSLGLAGYSVALWGLACIFGWGYFVSRNRGWKKRRKNPERTQHSAQ